MDGKIRANSVTLQQLPSVMPLRCQARTGPLHCCSRQTMHHRRMSESATPALSAETPPAIDPVTAYKQEMAAALSSPLPADYVDPHFVDTGRDPDAEEFGTADPDAEPVAPVTPTAPKPEPAEPVEEVLEPLEPNEDPDAPPPEPEPIAPTPEGSKPPQFRLRPKEGDKVGEVTMRLMRRNPDMTMEDAVARARSELGMPDASGPTPTQGDEPAPVRPPTENTPDVATLETELESLEDEEIAALKAMDYDRVAEIKTRTRELSRKLIPKAREAQARQSEQVASTFNTSAQQALAYYPDAAVEGSELNLRMIEIEEDLAKIGSPLVNDPNKPLLIAEMAARELAIAPKRKGPAQPPAAAPVTPATRPPARVSMTAPLAAPGARSNPPAVSDFDKQVDSVNDAESYEKLMASLTGRKL